jgi:hypothetical protein
MREVRSLELDELLIAAAESPPEDRITYRDSIAAYGDEAIDRLMAPTWIGDPNYAGFAVRAIAKAGELGASTAVSALRRAVAMVATDWHRRDIDAALLSLGARQPARASIKPKAPRVKGPVVALEDLVLGRCYRRADLHSGGLGGNRQKGISYPAIGTHCLLFSDPSKVHEHGYRDRPDGDNRYRYFGEWSGTGDMVMTGGNKAITDRSSELYLFTAAPCGHVFRGRHRLVEVLSEKAIRDGRQYNAVVFVLELLS